MSTAAENQQPAAIVTLLGDGPAFKKSCIRTPTLFDLPTKGTDTVPSKSQGDTRHNQLQPVRDHT